MTMSNMLEPATTLPAQPTLPKVLFFGTSGAFSRIALGKLLAAQTPICGFVMATYPGQKPIVRQYEPPNAHVGNDIHLYTRYGAQSTVELAWQHQIPVYEVARLESLATRKLVKTLAPDVACVACFSHKIPATLLAVPKQGFLNVHPSKLPAFRGPDPIFWQLQAGVDPFSVTVHWMDANWDSGDIAAQAALSLPNGLDRRGIEERCAELGGQLLVDVLTAVAQGAPPRTPQSAESSYQSWPHPEDFEIKPSWSARHAYNFMCGTADRHAFYPVTAGDKLFYLTKAMAFLPEIDMKRPFHRDAETIFIQCSPGVLCAEGVE